MGLCIELAVQKNENVQFDSIVDLNADLNANTGIGELLEESENKQFIVDNNGKILFQGRDVDRAYEMVEVWSLFGLDEAQVIANHIVSGTLVCRLDIEGNHPEYFKMTTGKAEKVKPSF